MPFNLNDLSDFWMNIWVLKIKFLIEIKSLKKGLFWWIKWFKNQDEIQH